MLLQVAPEDRARREQQRTLVRLNFGYQFVPNLKPFVFSDKASKQASGSGTGGSAGAGGSSAGGAGAAGGSGGPGRGGRGGGRGTGRGGGRGGKNPLRQTKRRPKRKVDSEEEEEDHEGLDTPKTNRSSGSDVLVEALDKSKKVVINC